MTYGNSVLDLQANKIDLAFCAEPDAKAGIGHRFHPPVLPARLRHGRARRASTRTNWADLDKPEVKIAFDIGSVHEIAARRFASHAQHIALKTRDECVLAVQSGRADCVIMAVNLGLTAVKKNPALGEFQMLHQPRIQLPTCMGVRKEANKDWRDFLNAWVDYNRGVQQVREWLYAGLAINGVKPTDIPSDVEMWMTVTEPSPSPPRKRGVSDSAQRQAALDPRFRGGDSGLRLGSSRFCGAIAG